MDLKARALLVKALCAELKRAQINDEEHPAARALRLQRQRQEARAARPSTPRKRRGPPREPSWAHNDVRNRRTLRASGGADLASLINPLRAPKTPNLSLLEQLDAPLRTRKRTLQAALRSGRAFAPRNPNRKIPGSR